MQSKQFVKSRFRIVVSSVFVLLAAMSSSGAALTGFSQTGAGTYDYNTAGNWVENTLPGNGIWDASLLLTAGQTVTFAADTTLAAGLTFNYNGNFALTLRSSGVANQAITLGSDVSVNPSSNQTVTIGSGTANQNLNIDLGGTTRTMTVAAGRTLTLQNVVSNGGITKTGAGTLTLNGNNTYSGGTTISAGTNILGNANALGTSGTITLGSAGSGARLMIVGLTISRPITVASGTGAVGLGGQNGNLSAAITLNRGVSLSGVNVYGGISGTGDVTIDSAYYGGYLATSFAAVSGGGVANTFSGNLYILSGATLNIGSGWASSISAIPDSSTVNVVGALSILKNANGETIDALTGNGGVTAASSGGTLTIGSANGSGAFSGAIGGSGAIIVKTGIGTEIFSGVNTYTGTTTVNGGALLINSPGSLHASSAVSVATWATLGGNGTINGSVTVAAGGYLAPGSAAGTIGKLTLASTLTLNGGFLAFDLNADTTAGTTYDQIAITSTLTMTGVNVIQLSSPSGSIATGTYTLMTFASSTASSFTFPNGTSTMTIGGSTLTLNNGTTSLTLTVADASAAVPPFVALKWKGYVNGAWDTSTANWSNGVASAAYAEGNQVTFDDTASGNFAVSGSTVSPLSVTVGNTVNAYTISAAITGLAPLLKVGSGTLTLSGANTYSGGTTLSAGTLNLANTTALGATASTLTISGGTTLDGNVTIANANPQNWNGDFTFSGASGSLNLGTGAVTPSANRTVTVSANTLTIGGAIGGGAKSLTKLGDGTLTLSGANTYSSTTTVGSGTLKIDAGAGGSLNTSSPLTFNTGGGVFNYDNTNAGGAKSQSLGALTLSAGEGTVQVTRSAAQTVTLTLAAPSRTAGATVNYVYTGVNLGAIGTANSINLTKAAGFIDVGSFVNGADYASMNGVNTYVRALAYGSDANSVAANTITASRHVKLTVTPASRVGDTLLSLNLAGSGVGYTMSSGTLTVPGILKAGGGTVGTISGGTAVTGGAGIELVIRTDIAGDLLTISTPVTGASSPLTKSGAGTLTLSGANTYSGATKVNAGILLVNNTHIVNSSAEAYTVLNGATLGGSGQIKLNQVITVNNGGVLAPGNGLATSLKIDGATKSGVLLTMSAGAKFAFTLDATGAGNPTMLDFWNYTYGDLTLTSNVVSLTLSGNHTPGTYTKSLFRFYSDAGSTPMSHGISSGLTIGTVESGISSPSITYSANTIDITYTILPGSADATQSTLMPTSASITANGLATQVLTVQAKDSYGNNLSTGGATVTITKSSGTGTIGSVTDNNNGTYTATVTAPATTGSGVFVATLGGDQVKNGTGSQTQTTVAFIPGPADHLTITSSSAGLIAGDARDITAEIRDAAGNLRTGDSTSVHFSQSGAGSVSGLPSDVAAVSGSATQQVTGSSGGSVTITAHADGLTDGSTTFTVLQSSASAYSIQVSGGSSATTSAGSGVNLTVIALDGSGNTMTDFDSDKALSFYGLASSPNSTVPTVTDKNGVTRSVTSTVGLPNATLTFVDGVANVGGAGNPVLMAYNGTSSAVTLHCSDGTKSSESTHGAGLSLTVNPASASTLTVGAFPASLTAGASGDVMVTAKDAYGNTDPGYAGTIEFTVGVADTGKTLPFDFTFVPATHHGSNTFSGGVTLTKAVASGGQSIIATDKNTGSISGTQSGITVNPGAANTLALDSGDGQFGSGSAALASPFVVKVTDIYNNLVPGITVDFSIATYPVSAAGQSVSPASPATGSDGKASSTLTLGDKRGAYTVTATASVPSGSPVTFTATASPVGSVIKAGTGTDLTAVGSWDGGAVPGPGNIAYWSSTSLGANLTLGSSESWGSITVEGALTDIGITGAGTLTLGESGIDLSASTVNLSIGNPITLGAAQTWAVNSARTLTVSGIVGGIGTSALVKDGAGTLTLLHTNTYSGDTTINSGTFEIGGAGQLGAGTYAGVITNNGLLRVNSSASQTLGGIVSGNGGLTKSSTGVLTLNGANAYTGGTTISAGTVIAGNANAFGTSGAITLGDASSGVNAISLSFGGNTISRPITVANHGGVVTLGRGNFTGAITLNRSVSLGYSGGACSFKGGISGTGNLTIVANSSYLVAFINTANTFIGNVQVDSGAELDLNNGNADSLSFIPDTSSVNVTGTLYNVNNGINETIDGLNGNGVVKGYNNTFTVGGGNGSGAFSGIITNGAGSVGLIKIGTGTQTLSGINTYTGVTTISNGTLKIAGGALANTAISLAGTSTFAVQPGSGTTINLGNTATSAAGATLAIGANNTFDMADGFVSICNLQQGATFSSAGLTVSSGATFKFNLGNATADRLAVTKAANVSGVVNVTIDTTGASSLTAGSYNLITASAGLTTGDPAWRFTGGGTSRLVTVGGAPYTLILIPSDTAITLACSLVSGTVYSVR